MGLRPENLRNHKKADLDEIVERSLRQAAIWDELKDRLNKVLWDSPADSSRETLHRKNSGSRAGGYH